VTAYSRSHQSFHHSFHQSLMNTTNENLSVQQQDQKTRDQVEAITEEIKASQRLTSHLIPIRELSDSFARLNDEDAKDSDIIVEY
jgi:hypothetical protein